ncbi:hypothetical protein B0T42_00210 [Rathayibacter sp. VKM Ac-2630]|nr:hypothetical protein B0T42_00210 [Rathayibacter sp. VKM Ac-2630]
MLVPVNANVAEAPAVVEYAMLPPLSAADLRVDHVPVVVIASDPSSYVPAPGSTVAGGGVASLTTNASRIRVEPVAAGLRVVPREIVTV